jgi:Zn-dependent metalloprotease
MCNISRAGHRHSIFCILPPHILEHIAKNGDKAQREFAVDTLSTDHTMRQFRSTQAAFVQKRMPMPMSAAPKAQVSIYSSNKTQTLPGSLVRGPGSAKSNDPSVDEAYDGLYETFAFYEKVLHRNSIDDAGMPLLGSVHFGTQYDNAFWNSQQMVFGDGDGTLFNRFTIALDVIGHELTHGVTEHTANLAYLGQSGALNESVSDVFGSLIKQYKGKQTASEADWLIGEGLLAKNVHGVALRSMKAPGTAYDDPTLGKDPQPANMKGYVHTSQDSGGVHINSGIPNHAFYLAAIALGGNAWDKAGHIWYSTLNDAHIKPSSTFKSFAQLTVANADKLYGVNGAESQAVTKAWKAVGVL